MNPQDTKRLLAAVRKTVKAELHLAEIFARHDTTPPPADLDAEQLLVAAVLDGVPPSKLSVHPKHFCSPWYRHVYGAAFELDKAGQPYDANAVCKRLIDSGVIGPVTQELARIETCPTYHVKRLYQLAGRVVELSKRRRLLALMGKLDAALRTDALEYGQALEMLGRKWARERKG